MVAGADSGAEGGVQGLGLGVSLPDYDDGLSEEAVVIVERLEPSSPPGVAGFYGSFARADLPRIEEVARLRWGRGRYLFEVRDEGEVVRRWSRTLAGGPAKDSEGNEIDSRGLATTPDPLSMRLAGGQGDSVVNDKFLLELVERKDREIERLRRDFEDLRERQESRLSELSERLSEARQRETELRGQLERERQNAQVTALAAKIDALGNKPEGSSFKEAFELAVKMLPKPRQTGLNELRDMKEVLDDLRGDRDEDGEDWSKVIGSALGEFMKLHREQSAEVTKAAPESAPAQPRPPAIEPAENATPRFLALLSSGLEDLPDPESWVREALPTLTPAGRRRLATFDLNDEGSVIDWLAGVPGLNLGKAVAALTGSEDRQRWLGEIFGLSRAILREESHAA